VGVGAGKTRGGALGAHLSLTWNPVGPIVRATPAISIRTTGCHERLGLRLSQDRRASVLSELNCQPHIPPCLRIRAGGLDHCLANPPASKWALSRRRRALDIAIAVVALLVAAAPMLLIGLCLRLTSNGRAALLAQRRVGRLGRLFPMVKFRTMAASENPHAGPGLTKDGDPRVTRFGRMLRTFKLDELPQLWNVLRGDMSLVGPRPKLPAYAALLNMPYRPGLTGAATVAFCREEKILSAIDARELDQFYAQHIKPLKARIDACYMCKATLSSDLRILAATIVHALSPAPLPKSVRPAPQPIGAPAIAPEQNPAP
jgi:lipopolysaccharide/colanic/teichoic acid biosynthesis glycosyltransferase